MRKIILCLALFLAPLTTFATYGANIFQNGTATCSTAEFGSCANLFDGNDSTYWLPENATYPHWAKYDLGTSTSKYLDKDDMYVVGDAGGLGVKTYSIYGSLDNSSWTQLYPTTTLSNDTTSKHIIDTSVTTTSFRYFEWVFPDSWRASPQTWIYEISGYECTDCRAGTSTTSSLLMSTTTDSIVGGTFALLKYLLDGAVIMLVAYFTHKFLKS